jgi:pimeloyl-ACP methyl ester carboxylesterase
VGALATLAAASLLPALAAAGATAAAAATAPTTALAAAPAGSPATAPAATPAAAPATPQAGPHDTSAGGEREGRGEREIVLLHGLGSSASVWDGVVPHLERAYRVWAYELPGHGRTPPLHRLTLETATADLERFLEANDIVYPVLVGHAMGGVIALQYALENPKSVRRLVIIDAAPMQLATLEERNWVVDQLVHNYDAFVADRFSNMSPRPDVTSRIVDQALRTDQSSFSSLLTSSFTFDFRLQLARQPIPIFVIGSEMFLPEPDRVGEQLDRLGFGAAQTISFKRMEATGHFVMLEQPDYTASLIGVFAAGR